MIELLGRVLNARGELVGGGLSIADGVLTEILPESHAPDGAWVTPGLVDVHCHGGGGESFPDNPTPESVATAVAAHRSVGTTALVASLVSLADPLPQIEVLVDSCERGDLAGIHLEGPYISPCKPGAQNPAVIRDPDTVELEKWLTAGKGWIRTMTLAPENPRAFGADSAAHTLLDHGALPSWGHTDATAEKTREALRDTVEYGAAIGFRGPVQTATHLFNAMPPLGHRAPGPVREYLRAAADGLCVVEMIGDGVHLDAALVGDGLEMLSRVDGVMLVTDAMAGAGMPDGDYSLGGLDVVISGGVAKLREVDTIAGGTSRLSDQLRVLVGGGHTTMERAVRAAVLSSARAVGVGPFGEHRGQTAGAGVTLDFEVGQPVNAVEMGADFTVGRVVREGQLV